MFMQGDLEATESLGSDWPSHRALQWRKSPSQLETGAYERLIELGLTARTDHSRACAWRD